MRIMDFETPLQQFPYDVTSPVRGQVSGTVGQEAVKKTELPPEAVPGTDKQPPAPRSVPLPPPAPPINTPR
jgi:hypothetical protein